MNDARHAYDHAHPGTVYWTVSLYIPATQLSDALGLPEIARGKAREIVAPDQWRQLVFKHRCSLALGGAMDPLFNDIADRDVQGLAQEFLVAADDDPQAEHPMRAAQELVLGKTRVTFTPPAEIGWVTEGRRYRATPPALSEPRETILKRFWFAHYGGALSYHLSFRYRYRPENASGPLGDGYRPANYYFLSMLQKLVAPKEFALPDGLLQNGKPSSLGIFRSVFDKTGVDLLDHKIVTGLAPDTSEQTRFWEGLRARFNADMHALARRIASVRTESKTQPSGGSDWWSLLLDDQPLIEVPGLGMPRCRFMFFFHDERFFGRLMPSTPDGAPAERKAMVRDDCYRFYLDRIRSQRDATKLDPVELDDGYWRDIQGRHEYYAGLFGNGTIVPQSEDVPFGTEDEQEAAIRSGKCKLTKDQNGKQLNPPVQLCIPAYRTGRVDCLDYLFLSGFNQNIIDFMAQDTSEILDSTDPLYPSSASQAGERFFVRFANHRALVTYVPSSRSLEIGNDYIGTCPYAFLIHALAMHNEYLDRLHETATARRVADIEQQLGRLRGEQTTNSVGKLEKLQKLNDIESLINEAKLAHFQEYQRYRYLNPFRYDTEHDVFKKLEELRGTSRKQQALQAALGSLEDHARDLARQERELAAERERDTAREQGDYETKVSTGLAVVGLSGIIQMIYALVTFRLDKWRELEIHWPFHGESDAVTAERVLAMLAAAFTVVLTVHLLFVFKPNLRRAAAIFALMATVIALAYFGPAWFPLSNADAAEQERVPGAATARP